MAVDQTELSPVQSALAKWLVSRGGNVTVDHIISHDWESLTFFGDKHEIAVSASSREPLERLRDGLEDAEVSLPYAILADIVAGDIKSISGGRFGVDVDALTVDERDIA